MALSLHAVVRRDRNTVESFSPVTAVVASGSAAALVPSVTGGSSGLQPMLVGASWSYYESLDSTLSNPTGSKSGGTNTGMSVRRVYETAGWPVSGNSFANSAAAADVTTRTCASMWSMSDTSWIPTFATGSQNSNLTAFFDSIPAGHRFYAIFWHEVDQHTSGWTVTQYQDAFANIRAALEASTADRSLVKAGGLLTSGAFRNGDGDTYFDSNHDFVGIDFYHYYDPDPASPFYGQYSPRTASYLAGDAVSKAQALDVPLIVGEISIHPDPANAAYRPGLIADDFAYLDGVDCQAVCWFHSYVGSRGPWWLDSYPNWSNTQDHTSNPDPDSLAAYRTVLSTHVRYGS